MKKNKSIIWTTIIIAILCVLVFVVWRKTKNESIEIKTDEVSDNNENRNETPSDQQNVDTIPLEEYLELFKSEFPDKVYLTREPESVPSLVLNGESLSDKHILMNNGAILPPINGHAYSYKRISDEILWLISFKVGRYGGASDIFLHVLNENHDSLENSYLLSNSFGEDGYFSYQNGEFINDSTFQYKKVWNDEKFKKDSLSGVHIIR